MPGRTRETGAAETADGRAAAAGAAAIVERSSRRLGPEAVIIGVVLG
jgi:hypothetical protein